MRRRSRPSEVIVYSTQGGTSGKGVRSTRPREAVKHGLSLEDIVDTVRVFPTHSEAIKLAALPFFKDVHKLTCCALLRIPSSRLGAQSSVGVPNVVIPASGVSKLNFDPARVAPSFAVGGGFPTRQVIASVACTSDPPSKWRVTATTRSPPSARRFATPYDVKLTNPVTSHVPEATLFVELGGNPVEMEKIPFPWASVPSNVPDPNIAMKQPPWKHPAPVAFFVATEK